MRLDEEEDLLMADDKDASEDESILDSSKT
jgi:hypothetical protein